MDQAAITLITPPTQYMRQATEIEERRALPGPRLRRSLEDALINGLNRFDVETLVRPFRARSDAGGGFRGEFWGKWALAAMAAIRTTNDQRLADHLESSVQDICDSADDDGYIGTYPAVERLAIFDIWNIKYTSWALLEYGRSTGKTSCTVAAYRLLRWLRARLQERGVPIESYGLDVLCGAGSLSILYVLAKYSEEGDDLWRFGQELVRYSRETPDAILHQMLSGQQPNLWPSAKAYELMSVLEGFGELARRDSDTASIRQYLDLVDLIHRAEISVIGSCSSQELFAGTATTQTRPLPQPHETCVTYYWMRLCRLALALSGDAKWAEAIETSLHNALLGALAEDGSWWSYFTVLEGYSRPSPCQFTDINASCCVVNGYRALYDASSWAIDELDDQTVRINSLADGSLASGSRETLTITGDFLRTGEARVRLNKPGRYKLRIRKPSWSRAFRTSIDGQQVSVLDGQGSTWCELDRTWSEGDIVEICAEIQVYFVTSPSDANAVAVQRGTYVLAAHALKTDARYPFAWFSRTNSATTDQADDTLEVSMPIEFRPSHYFGWKQDLQLMRPFADLSSESLSNRREYRVWFPQPWLIEADPADTAQQIGEAGVFPH